MKVAAIASVILGVLAVALFTLLLCYGLLTQPFYTGLVSVVAFVCLVIVCLPRLKVLDLKNLRMTLSEGKQLKAQLEEMYGAIDRIRKAPFVLDAEKMAELGIGSGIPLTGATARYVAGCVTRERERLARIFAAPKEPDKLAEAILDHSFDEKIFKWRGPEASLDAPPPSGQK